jgi:uncharacterized protein YndB with AHSA1/START domain
MDNSTISNDTILIERTFDAPVNLIWQMWTQPEHLKHWYGPEGFNISVAEMDVRVGGKHLICMERQTPDGSMKFWTVGEYTEVNPTSRLVYTDSMSDEHGNVITHSEEADYPLITIVTVLLEDIGGRTKMVMTHAGVPAGDEGASAGWEQAFTKLANHIKTIRK